MAVTELRLVVTTDDYDTALDFFRDVLGLTVAANYDTESGRATLLEAVRARLELFDARQAAYIDDVEVGRRVAGHIRIAFEVDDTVASTEAAVRRCDPHRSADAHTVGIAELQARGSGELAAHALQRGAGQLHGLIDRVARGHQGARP